jgi:hypothetical protein
MAFTDRFLEIPVIIRYILDDGNSEQPIDEIEETIELILPLDISSFLPEGELTNICMKSGRTITTTLNFNEFQERVNKHFDDQSRK